MVQSSILVLRDRRWSENGTSDLDLRDSFCISYSYQLKLSSTPPNTLCVLSGLIYLEKGLFRWEKGPLVETGGEN